MATIADLRVPAEEFVLARTLRDAPDVGLQVERVAAHENGSVLPLVWVTTDAFDELEDAFEDDPTVNDVSLLADLDGERLYRMEWIDRVDIVVHALVEEEGTILNAHAEEGWWHLRIMFPDREALSSTYEFCKESDLRVEVEAIYELDEERGGRFGLTDDQYETLSTALEKGYYEVPREISLGDLAEELDVSHQSLSERIRRGHRNLLERTIESGFEDQVRGGEPGP